MTNIRGLAISPPIFNSSCPWASSIDQLTELYDSPHTGAVTTRTATLNGFAEDPSLHQVAFASDSYSSINSYGYSPHPLSYYISSVNTILSSHPSSAKPFIMSITSSSPTELSTMIQEVRAMRSALSNPASLIAIELNTSCPNIKNKPPPSYSIPTLQPLLSVLADHFSQDPTLTFGIKLPPYVHAGQFKELVDALEALIDQEGRSPIAFLTCTNTLGSSLLFVEQQKGGEFIGEEAGFAALPTALGGLAGESIHALSLGNVHSFSSLLASSSVPSLQKIKVIGVGGVTSPQAARRMIRAGASAVACATALGTEGVQVFEKLKEGVNA